VYRGGVYLSGKTPSTAADETRQGRVSQRMGLELVLHKIRYSLRPFLLEFVFVQCMHGSVLLSDENED
jgi:predicted transcriptional regulator